VVVSRRGENFVTAAQHVLPHDLCRHVRIARLGEVAVRGSTNEAAFTLRIEPAQGLAIWNDWSEGCAWTLIDAWPALLAPSATLSAATALVAAASSIVTVIALAMLSPSPSSSSATTSADFALLLAGTASASCLGIVRRLLL